MALDRHTRDRLLRRIGLAEPPAADAAGLRLVHRAFVTRVPYEALAPQLDEFAPLDLERLVRRVLTGGRGGYCFEANTVLKALLESLGFTVQRHQAVVGPRVAGPALPPPTNHMALVVQTPQGPFIAEAGLGEGPLDPLPLAPGPVSSGAFELRIEREPDGWWVNHHRFGSFEGFRFADQPATLEEFQPHHRRLSTSPESSFVKTLVVSTARADRIIVLRARTLAVLGPGRAERQVLAGPEELATTLGERFGIDPAALGARRVQRLWARAAAQHAVHLAGLSCGSDPGGASRAPGRPGAPESPGAWPPGSSGRTPGDG